MAALLGRAGPWRQTLLSCSLQEGRLSDVCNPPFLAGGEEGGERGKRTCDCWGPPELPGRHGGGSDAGATPSRSSFPGRHHVVPDVASKARAHPLGLKHRMVTFNVTSIPVRKMSKPLLRTVSTLLPALEPRAQGAAGSGHCRQIIPGCSFNVWFTERPPGPQASGGQCHLSCSSAH